MIKHSPFRRWDHQDQEDRWDQWDPVTENSKSLRSASIFFVKAKGLYLFLD